MDPSDQRTVLNAALKGGSILDGRTLDEGAEVLLLVKEGTRIRVRRHHTEIVCPDGVTIRFGLGNFNAIDTMLLGAGVEVRVNPKIDRAVAVLATALTEPESRVDLTRALETVDEPSTRQDLKKVPDELKVAGLTMDEIYGPECTCPEWWFPKDRREALRKLPHGHGGVLAHYQTCPKNKDAG